MAKKKRSSPILVKAQKRLAGLKSIDPNLDLGSGVSVAGLTSATTSLQTALDAHNQTLALSDQQLNGIGALEKQVRDLSSRALEGVAAKWGKDSSQYEQAGGTRTSERKKPKRKPKAAAATTKA